MPPLIEMLILSAHCLYLIYVRERVRPWRRASQSVRSRLRASCHVVVKRGEMSHEYGTAFLHLYLAAEERKNAKESYFRISVLRIDAHEMHESRGFRYLERNRS